jgi:sporulation protein YtfJ
MEQKEQNYPLNALLETTIASVRAMADANAIVGTPIQADDVTLIPISRLSFGVMGGGTDFSTKKQPAGEKNFGGGSGASAKLDPVAFVVIRGGSVKLLPVAPPPATTVDRVIDTVPEVVDKVTDFIEKQQEKKSGKGENADFAE